MRPQLLEDMNEGPRYRRLAVEERVMFFQLGGQSHIESADPDRNGSTRYQLMNDMFLAMTGQDDDYVPGRRYRRSKDFD